VRTGEVISRLTNDTTLLQAVIGYGFSLAVRNSLLLVGALAMLAWTNLKLTLIVVCIGPLVVLPVMLLGRRVRRFSPRGQDRVADVSIYVDEALHEIRTVQAYTHEDHAGAHSASASKRPTRAVSTHRDQGTAHRARDARGIRRRRLHSVDRAAAMCSPAASRPATSRIRLL
jgi:ATP-binding cassette subfamily B protein